MATTAAIASPSDLADRIQQKLEKKFGGKHGKHGIIIGGDHDEGAVDLENSHEDIPAMVIPLVGIVFLTIFGAPVLIVIAIGIFALLVSRSRQRTIRMMVEKGQPVPRRTACTAHESNAAAVGCAPWSYLGHDRTWGDGVLRRRERVGRAAYGRSGLFHF